MPDLVSVVIQAPALMALLLVQRQLRSERAVRSWVLAWLVAYLSSLANQTLDPNGPWGWVISGTGILFSCLIFQGAWIFAARPRLRVSPGVLGLVGWFASVGVSFVSIRAGLVLAALILGAFLLAAARQVWFGRHPRGFLEGALCAALAALAVAQLVPVLVGPMSLAGGSMERMIWEGLSSPIALLQIGVVVARGRRLVDVATDTLKLKQENALDFFLASPIPLVLVSQSGRVELVNERLRQALGLGPREPGEGWTIPDLLVRAGGKLFNSDGNPLGPDALSTEAPSIGSFDFWPDAEPGRCLEVTSMSVPQENLLGPAASGGTILLLRDVTEQRRMMEFLREAERHETAGTLARGIAHDFNNQLASILVNAGLLRSEIADREGSLEKVESIVASSERCAEMTSELLSLARRGPTALDAVDLATVVGQAVRLVRPLMAVGIEIEMQLSRNLPPLAADASELQRVLVRLLVNASEALGRSGRVVISARGCPEDPDRLEIEIADDGPGIAPDVLGRIFDPFFSTREREGGLGLGLAVVRGIVEAHGGKVKAGGSSLGGASFRLSWPIAKATGKRDQIQTRLPRIVVVSPDETSRTVFRTTLDVAGFEVLSYPDVSGCRALLGGPDEAIDAVLFDSSVSLEDIHAVAADLRDGAREAAFFALRRDGEGRLLPANMIALPEACPPETLISALQAGSHPEEGASS